MNISLELPEIMDLKPRISVIGVGGAGCNAINNMIATGLEGVEFIAANTDAQALTFSKAEKRIQLGAKLTEGLGAGADPEIGLKAAEEAIEEIRSQISGSHMLFLAAGMGGGTGTGAASVIAKAAREMDILTVAIVSKPFNFEGARRMRVATAGIEMLQDCVDTLIVIPNQNLFHLANEKTTFADAFVMADNVLYSGIACIVDLIVKDGHINLDFADVKAIMKGMGPAMMGTGEASGENRAAKAAQAAISNPLLSDISLRGAQGLLISIIGGRNLTLFEVDEAASCVKQQADPEANIIVGATFEEGMDECIRVSIVASGLPGAKTAGTQTSPSKSEEMAPDRKPQRPAATGSKTADTDLAVSSKEDEIDRQDGAVPASHSRETENPSPIKPPQLPHHENSRDHGNPYLGETSADEFARALSEVMGTCGDNSKKEGREALPDRKNQPQSAWRSPDGVVIEDGFEPAFAPPPLPAATPAHEMATQSTAEFTPRPPAELPRRLPDVAEFPHIAQRAYHAKTAQNQRHAEEAADTHTIFKRLARLARQPNQKKSGADQSPSRNNDAPKEPDSATDQFFLRPEKHGRGNM